MSKVPTVAVEYKGHPDGYMLINESDFDKDKHKLYNPNKKKSVKKKKAKKDE